MTLLDSANPVAGSRVPPSIRLDDLVAATGGRLLGPTTVTHFTTAAVDSRHVIPGSLFVALRGERVDGHAFVAEAAANGATAALVERPVTLPAGSTVALVQVPDALTALQELAAWWRSRSAVRVVGITGSTGKTIAKEIVADVLSRTRSVLRNEGNLNSETGLPMTLLRLEPAHEVAVLEMSMYTGGRDRPPGRDRAAGGGRGAGGPPDASRARGQHRGHRPRQVGAPRRPAPRTGWPS